MSSQEAKFSLNGISNVGQKLTIQLDSEGSNGADKFSYIWESSTDGINWENIGEEISYEITPSERINN